CAFCCFLWLRCEFEVYGLVPGLPVRNMVVLSADPGTVRAQILVIRRGDRRSRGSLVYPEFSLHRKSSFPDLQQDIWVWTLEFDGSTQRSTLSSRIRCW